MSRSTIIERNLGDGRITCPAGKIVKEKDDTQDQKFDAKARADKYGEDKLAAQKKIDTMRFSWTNPEMSLELQRLLII